MSISDAYVTAECEQCGYEEPVQLTALAHRGSWDERHVLATPRRRGWSFDDDAPALCPECAVEVRQR